MKVLQFAVPAVLFVCSVRGCAVLLSGGAVRAA